MGGRRCRANLGGVFQRYKDFEPRRKELDAMTSIPGMFSKVLHHQENTFYNMDRARRALNLKPRGKKS